MGWGIDGNEWAVDLLRGQIARGRVSHAYLFTGPDGVGRRTLALRFAQTLSCRSPLAPGEPCGECRTCRNIEKQEHTDLLVVQRFSDKTQTQADQIRQLRYDLSLTPFESPYKIALLLRFEEASPAAQAALLKTLEEAPSRAVLLITCSNPDAIQPTVLSRCEVLRLRPQPASRLAESLATRHVSLPEGLTSQLAARLADGCPGRAQRLAGDKAWLERRASLINASFDILKMSRRERFTRAHELFFRQTRNPAGPPGAAPAPARPGEKPGPAQGNEPGDGSLNSNREAMRQALNVWISLWRDILVMAVTPAAGSPDEPSGGDLDSPLVNLDYTEQIAAAARQLGYSQARQQVERLSSALEKVNPPYNTNPRLLGEALLLDWPFI